MRINSQKFYSDLHIYTPNPKQIKNNDILSSLELGLVAHTYNQEVEAGGLQITGPVLATLIAPA